MKKEPETRRKSGILPDSVKVGAYTVRVVYVENLLKDVNACGQYVPRRKEIQIDPSMCPEQQYGTFCHELIEALVEIYEMPSLTGNHHDIVLMGEGLHALLRDNGMEILPE